MFVQRLTFSQFKKSKSGFSSLSYLNNPSFNHRNNIWKIKLDDMNSVILTSAHNVIDVNRSLFRDDIVGSLVNLEWSIPCKYLETKDRRFDLAYFIYRNELKLGSNQTTFYPSYLYDRFLDVKILTMNNTNIDGIDNYTSSPLLISTSLSLSNEILNKGDGRFIYEAYNVGHRGISGSAVFQNNYFVGLLSCLGSDYGKNSNSKTRSVVYSWNWIKKLLKCESVYISALNFKNYHVYISESKFNQYEMLSKEETEVSKENEKSKKLIKSDV